MKTSNPTYKASFLVGILLILTINESQAQKNFTLYNLNTTSQSLYLNPGNTPTNKLYFNLPLGIQTVSVINSGFTLSDILTTREKDDSLVINPTLAIDKMNTLNYLNMEMSNELLGIGFKLKNNYLSFNVTNRFQSRFTYPKGLFQATVQGNGGEHLGERISMDGLGFDLLSFMEYGASFQKTFKERLSVGLRLKFLSGIVNVETTKSQLGLYTDPDDYALTLDGQMAMNTSNVSQFYNSPGSSTIGSFLGFKNKGFGMDLGANYKLNGKINLNASILDVGFIKWTSNVSNFESNSIDYTFEGLDINQMLSDSTYLSSGFYDSLSSLFGYQEKNESYRTSLHTKFYIGGTYQLNEKITGGLLMYNEIVASNYTAGFCLSSNFKLKNWLQASLNYSTYGRSFNNIGFGLNLKAGPIQFFAASDNISVLFNPARSKSIHISTGINYVINEDFEKDKAKDSGKPKF